VDILGTQRDKMVLN